MRFGYKKKLNDTLMEFNSGNSNSIADAQIGQFFVAFVTDYAVRDAAEKALYKLVYDYGSRVKFEV